MYPDSICNDFLKIDIWNFLTLLFYLELVS